MDRLLDQGLGGRIVVHWVDLRVGRSRGRAGNIIGLEKVGTALIPENRDKGLVHSGSGVRKITRLDPVGRFQVNRTERSEDRLEIGLVVSQRTSELEHVFTIEPLEVLLEKKLARRVNSVRIEGNFGSERTGLAGLEGEMSSSSELDVVLDPVSKGRIDVQVIGLILCVDTARNGRNFASSRSLSEKGPETRIEDESKIVVVGVAGEPMGALNGEIARIGDSDREDIMGHLESIVITGKSGRGNG